MSKEFSINNMPTTFHKEVLFDDEGNVKNTFEIAKCFFKNEFIILRRKTWRELFKAVMAQSRRK